jgi:thiol-disulfide isomerase/thioredoxin
MHRKYGWLALAVLILAGCGAQQAVGVSGPLAPDFIGGKADWINSPPLSLRQIARTHKTADGKPVHAILVDYWEYTCINCIRTMPYLKEWNRRYAKDGLLIVGIHTPEFQFAANKSNVAAAVKRFGLTYPILVDSGYKNWNAWGEHYWPHHYLLNGSGMILHDRAGEGGYRETELQIQALLKAANPGLRLPAPMSTVRDTDAEGAVCYPMTAETYAGYVRGRLGNPGGARRDVAATYTDPRRYGDGVPMLSGKWKATSQSVRHVGANPADYAALQYHALDVYAVMKPEAGKAVRVYVTQDGKSLPAAAKGGDIRFDGQHRSYITVDTARMYHVVHNPAWGHHLLRLSPQSEGLGLYSYTFGSCTTP